jgi:hypothetical protein
MLFIAPEKERTTAMRTVLIDQPDSPGGISEGNQVLAK